jgi:hypothetical protein
MRRLLLAPALTAAALAGFVVANSAAAWAAGPAKVAAKPQAQKTILDTPEDPAKVEAARQFIILYHPKTDPKNIAKMIDNYLRAMIPLRKRDDPKFDVKKFEKETRARVTGNTTRSLTLQSRVLSRHFSLPELKALIAFFKTPLGRKLVTESPKVQAEIRHIHSVRGEGPKFIITSRSGHGQVIAKDDDADEDEDEDAPKSPAKAPPNPKK